MFKALFSAKGRMRRRDWWLWSIGVGLAYFLSELLMHRLFGERSFAEDAMFKGVPSNGFHYWLLFLATAGQWPGICLIAKRWHDRNRPGWLAIIGLVIGLPLVALSHFGDLVEVPGLRFVVGAAQALLGFAQLGYGLWVLVDCGILDGTQGPNRYGPSPKSVGAQPQDVF